MGEDRRSFGALLKRYRRAAGLTHEGLAERASLSARAISDLERGVSQRPRMDTLAMLLDALDLSPTQRATLLEAARPELSARSASSPALVASGLPLAFSSFVGREREASALRSLLTRADTRLVTVTGPGGVGKTRLAVEAAASLIDAFADGVVFVGLAPVTDRDGILAAALGALGAGNVSAPSFAALADALGTRSLLLALDNWEHLLDAAPLLTDLLRACPRLTVLATSRAALRLSGERELPLAPLATPDAARPPGLDALAANPAVELFVDRARLAYPPFELSAENAPSVAAICARLDGLPLALELAAARMKLLTPDALLARLMDDAPGKPLAVLAPGARDWPERHQSLRDTIAWSYHLLDPVEQRLLRCLSVFVGGCSIEAAEAVCGDDATGYDALSVLDGLSSLIDKSLLQRVDGPDGAPRIVLLETIRQYAYEQLVAQGEHAAAAERHARHYLAQVEATGGLLFAGSSLRARGAAEQHNIHAALTWLVLHG